jgi:glutaconate CoA-transferase, subunit B
VSASSTQTRAETLVTWMARQIDDGAVVATGVASPLAILAIAVARATHAPNLTYLACVGALDPALEEIHRCSEDLAYLEGRSAEISIPELFDHARCGRVDTIFFGALEIDGFGRTNMTASGALDRPRAKFPGVAGASTLRRFVRRPILIAPKQSRRSLVDRVQFATTSDPASTTLATDLGVFEVGPDGASLVARHAHADLGGIAERTGFEFRVATPLPVTPPADARTLEAIRRIDPARYRDDLVG